MFEIAVGAFPVWAVQSKAQFALIVDKNHCMSAVGGKIGTHMFFVKQVIAMRPFALDEAVVGGGDGYDISFFGEVGPYHRQNAVVGFEQKRSVGNAAFRPSRVFGKEELQRLAYKMSEVGRQFGRSHTAVVVGHARPFVHEHHPRLTVFVDVQSAVDGVPVLRRNAAAGNILKRPQGVVRAVYRDDAVVVC